jgi:class 3 adenylate cyclase/predicted ATPase
MSRVSQWLETIGLAQYADAFHDNDIDIDLLGQLDDQILKDIGVSSAGHRLRIRNAIAKLNPAVPLAGIEGSPGTSKSSPAATPAPTPTPTTAAIAVARPEATGERRHVTVMFCDLVDSTGISAKLDAEEWRDLVGAYLDAASAAVTEMGGKVAKKLGDGLMALFGYPVAQENDAERAVRAALSIQRALPELNRNNEGTGKPALSARIAIDIGPAVLDAAGEIFGDVANVAARAQALADPGAVVVTARVQRQVAGLFVAEEQGSHELKGVPEAVTLYRIVRASGGGRRAGQRHLTPLVGRDEEIAMLMRRWERARPGDGQLVLIIGEPGIGKSRLIEEFHARLRDTPHTWAEWSCSQLLQNTPLHPVTEWGRQRFGGAVVPAERRLADLENTLTLIKLDPAENVPLLAPLFDLPLPKERMLALAPEELRRRQLAALTNWVIAGARVQPVVLALEDLHWADPTTLDVLRGVAERGALAPLFIVATARPEFRPPWSMRSHHGTISLAPLDRSQVRDMVAELSARQALSRDVMEDVAARTGGVPLFIEEVTRLLLERGEQGGIQAIPPTLQQSLMARLDRLGPAREVAQIGAVIGRDFSHSLLRAVAGMADALLQTALERLAEADILLVQGVSPEPSYRFKHALIQDAAYENLLKSRRQALHRRVAEILRDRFAATAAAEPEALAHHFTQAGMTDAAIEWWGKAGDQALRRSAFQEAISHLGKAIEMADKAGDGAPRAAPAVASAGPRLKNATTSRQLRLQLQNAYSQALMYAKGFTAPETSAALAQARDLAAGSENPTQRLPVHFGLWINQLNRGELAAATISATSLLREANSNQDLNARILALRMCGVCELLAGDFAVACEHFEELVELYDPAQHRDLAVRFGVAIGAYSVALWALGQIRAAAGIDAKARAQAEAETPAAALANFYTYSLLGAALRRDCNAILANSGAMVGFIKQPEMRQYAGFSAFFQGVARRLRGEHGEGVTEMHWGAEQLQAQGVLNLRSFFIALIADAEAEGGEIEAALASVNEALISASQTGERWVEAEAQRIRGEILLKREPANKAAAEEAFRKALAIAQKQKAKSFELRTATSMARLWRDQGKRDEARELLAPVYGWFTEGFDTLDLKEAKKLLDELAS